MKGRRHAPGGKKTWLLVGGALLALNAAVVVYHGDPRSRMPRAAQLERRAQASDDEARRQRRPSASERAQAQRLLDEVAGHATWVFADGAAERAFRLGHFRDAILLDAVAALPVQPWERSVLDPTLGLHAPGEAQRVVTVTLRSGQTPATAMLAQGVPAGDVTAAIASLSSLVDFRRMRPGHKLRLVLSPTGALSALTVLHTLADELETRRAGSGWAARRVDIPVQTQVAQVAGTVHSTLWDAVVGAGEEPALITEFVDVFAWEVDFYRDVRAGDEFRVLVEKRFARGKFLGYGKIVAAEYKNEGESHQAFVYERGDGALTYYDEEGNSLRKELLKAPLQYGRMTSGFGSRNHPVLGFTRQHNGVDYGVPTGTPVWSVGDGRVVTAGWSGGYGKLVEVSHANGWLSQYAHLSSIDVRVGQRVTQKQTIGKVGTTGMSTGPHLHYGLKRAGSYVNPAAQRFERQRALEGAERERFVQSIVRLRAELTAIRVALGLWAQGAREG